MTDTTSYIEHACTLSVSGWQIPAALTLPIGALAAQPLPTAILLIPGSLFSDVNGDYPSWNSFPHVYGHLARQLSARGHAVYRFAKLGPGTGSVAIDPELSAKVRSWDGRLTIASAALDQMQRELNERGVRVTRTIVAGHSEGAVVATRLAESERAPDLDGVVLLAGPSVGILEIMREQVGIMLPPEQLAEETHRLDQVIECVRRGAPIPAELATGAGTGASGLASMPEDARRYMRDSDATNPAELAKTLQQPVLVLQGDADDIVLPHHGDALRAALSQRTDPKATTDHVVVQGVSHMFKVVPPGVSAQDAFGYPGDTDPRVTDAIDGWLRTIRV